MTKIRFLEDEVTPKMIVDIKDKTSKKKQPFYDSLNWIWFDIYRYKTNKNKWEYIAIPANTKSVLFNSTNSSKELCDDKLGCLPKIKHTNKVVYRDEYWDYVKNFIESSEYDKITIFEHFSRIFKNTLIQNEEGEIFYISGVRVSKSVEIKPLTNRIKNKKRMIKVINKLEGWAFIDRDILGRTLSKKVID